MSAMTGLGYSGGGPADRTIDGDHDPECVGMFELRVIAGTAAGHTLQNC